MSFRVNFDPLPWESPMPGVRHKVFVHGSQRIRLVEYSAAMPPHWCERGHVGHIVSGALEIEAHGVTEVYVAGDALFIPGGPEHAHRATVRGDVATALFVEECPIGS